jgi:hypothetical protein
MSTPSLNPGLQNCGQGTYCPGSDYPVSNYSSEAEDSINFLAMVWPGGGPTGLWPGLGGGGAVRTLSGEGPGVTGVDGGPSGVPPLGSDPDDWPCVGLGASPVSQQDAALCAALAAQTCGNSTTDSNCAAPIWDTANPQFTPPTGVTLYYNAEQSCTVTCPNGSQFTYTIAAGRLGGTSQSFVNQTAKSLVCEFASKNTVCLGPPTNRPPYDPLNFQGGVTGYCCSGLELSGESLFQINASGFTFSVSAGQLPVGVALVQDSDTTAALSGTATTPGNYAFTVTASNGFGQSVSQSYTVSVLGFTTGNVLPEAGTGQAYIEHVSVAGGQQPYTFALIGALPSGLSLSSSGLISGTPTTDQVSNFAVAVTDAGGQTCTQDYQLTVVTAINMAQVTFYNYSYFNNLGSSLGNGSPAGTSAASYSLTIPGGASQGTAGLGFEFSNTSGRSIILTATCVLTTQGCTGEFVVQTFLASIGPGNSSATSSPFTIANGNNAYGNTQGMTAGYFYPGPTYYPYTMTITVNLAYA